MVYGVSAHEPQQQRRSGGPLQGKWISPCEDAPVAAHSYTPYTWLVCSGELKVDMAYAGANPHVVSVQMQQSRLLHISGKAS